MADIRISLRTTIAFTLIVSAILFITPLLTAQTLPRILIGNMQKGKQISVSDLKLEAGLALAVELTGKYILISGKEADSLVTTVPKTADMNVLTMAQVSKAQAVVFVRVDRLQNIVRAEIQLAFAPNFKKKTTGTGFALIRYRKEKNNEQLLDPALLLAFQRAFAVAIADSNTYRQLQGSLQVYPASPMVIGGLEYINNTSLTPWALFQKTEVQSYDAVLTMFDVAKEAKRYACFDADTRDSIFALFHLLLMENNKAPTQTELDALYKLEVRHYITGKMERTDSGAHLTVQLCSIQEHGGLTVLKTVEGDVADDNVKMFRETLTTLTKQVLE